MLDSLAKLDQLERNLDRWLPDRPATSSQSPARADLAALGLLDFIPACSPEFQSPNHLGPLVDAIERSITEPVRFCFTVPPQHGKSETLLHGVPWAWTRRPKLRVLYATYGADFARKQSKHCKALALAAGFGLVPGSNLSDEWETTAGGCFLARGVGGGITGRGFDLIIVDDPVKGFAASISVTIRDATWDWFLSDALSRLSPHGSVLVVHTRWHLDDVIGRVERLLGWPVKCLRAIAEPGDTDRPDGTALWPSIGRTLDCLEEIRARDSYKWAALYQGRPIPLGSAIFHEPTFYDELPDRGYQVGYGLDLAYTAKTSADFSVCLRLIKCGDLFYVAEVQRKQVDAPSFVLTLKAMHSDLAGPMLWHASGTEKGAAQFIQQRLPALRVKPTTADKLVRAQAVAAAWNTGKVLVPRDAPWLDSFVAEVLAFTGVNDPHDDQVDALASAHAVLAQTVTADAYSDMKSLFGEGPQRRRI